MIPDRIVLGFLIVGFLVLLIGFISIALRWMSNDARVRGRSRWIPATLFLGLPLIGGISGILLRARIPIIAGIIFVLPFIGIVVWLIVRPRYLQSANEKPDHAAISLRRRLGWLCASAVIFVVATPFCISFLIVGAARHPGLLKADVDPSTHRLNPRIIALRNGKVLTQNDPKIDLGYTFEDVEFPAVDGKTLRGWFVPSNEASSVAVIAVHGGGEDRRGFLRKLPIFHNAGYPVLLFDCRNYGASDGDGKGASFGINESHDVSSAAYYLKRSRGFHQTVAVGWSQGATAAILAAGKDPNLDGVIAEASHGDLNDLIGKAAEIYGIPHWLASLTVRMGYWRLNVRSTGTPLEAVAHISPRPILLIHGTEDKTIPFQASQMLFARAGQPKSLWLAPKSGHSVFSAYPEEYKQRVTSFLHTFSPLSKAVPK